MGFNSGFKGLMKIFLFLLNPIKKIPVEYLDFAWIVSLQILSNSFFSIQSVFAGLWKPPKNLLLLRLGETRDDGRKFVRSLYYCVFFSWGYLDVDTRHRQLRLPVLLLERTKLCLVVNLVRSCKHLKLFTRCRRRWPKKRQFHLRSSFLFYFPVPWVEMILQIVKINISMTSLLTQFYHKPRHLVHYCDWLPTGSPVFRSRYCYIYFYSHSPRICETQLTFFPVYTRCYFRSKVAMTSF